MSQNVRKIRRKPIVRKSFFAPQLAVLIVALGFGLAPPQAEAQTLWTRPWWIHSATHSAALQPAFFTDNPALFSDLASPILSLNVSPARFGMRELASAHGLYAAPADSAQQIAYAATLEMLGGSPLYNEFAASVAATRSLTASTTIAAGLRYSRFAIYEALPRSNVSFQISAVEVFSDWLRVGAALNNLFPMAASSGYAEFPASQPQQALISFGIAATSELCFDAGAEFLYYAPSKSAGSLNLAARYALAESAQVRFAAQTYPRALEVGVRLRLGAASTCAMLHLHETLGASQTFGVVYEWR